ncbi:MAG TPA: ParB N-terminal domain-containing protein [Kofleriaceae bacterium]|nr:ParB N-terminal domain-containing protein [Kofleriaceae bacterium]
MDVDLHQLELRHHDLRIHDAEQRRRLIGSVAEIGQQVPVIVIREDQRLVLIDGYLRVEALRKLGRDTAAATAWPVDEVEALLHRRHLCIAVPAIEDAWLLARLRDHGLALDDLARRLCRSKSWVSRRLALIEALTPAAQARVRAGTVPPHAAMKYLVPLARANKRQCEQLVTGLGETRVSDRELGALYDAWRCADRVGKQRIVAEPLLVLRALAATSTADIEDESAPLHKDFTMLAAISWRASRRVRGGDRLTAELTRAWRAAREAFASLGTTIEEMHAGPDDTTNHSETS